MMRETKVARDRPRLVLLPGLGDDAELWSEQVRVLADVCRTCVIDLRDEVDVTEMAEVVLDSLDGSFALAGFSMGGRVALAIMRRCPQRVEGLALVSVSARAGTQTIAAPYAGSLDEVIEREFIGAMHPDARRDARLAARVGAMVRRQGLEVLARQQRAIMRASDRRGELARIRCPTLVVCGREDPVTPMDRAEEIAARIPGARLCVIDRCGHYAPLERPDAVSQALREWLAPDGAGSARRGEAGVSDGLESG
jgi:pimeloyl-ACP methyl ester carboxylesterase